MLEIGKIISILVVVFCAIIILFSIFMIIRAEIARRNQTKIMDAIYFYGLHCICKREQILVDFDDMESFDSTYFRLWDFGYKRILPKEKYEIIKEYIE